MLDLQYYVMLIQICFWKHKSLTLLAKHQQRLR